MAEMRGPSEGVRGVDVEAPNGSKRKLEADKSGKINVDDKKLVAKLKAEGFTVATTLTGGFGGPDHRCVKCSFNSVFRVFTCPKCGEANDFRS